MLPLELPLAPDIGDTLVAASPAMLEAVRQLALYAVAQTPLIRVGATGTGKAFCARVALGCRVVIGVDDDPDALVATRRLHPHLRYRFAYNAVRLPPLNERRDEIPAFAQRFLEECPARTGVAEGPRVIAREALATLVMADYPGNVRQLRGMI